MDSGDANPVSQAFPARAFTKPLPQLTFCVFTMVIKYYISNHGQGRECFNDTWIFIFAAPATPKGQVLFLLSAPKGKRPIEYLTNIPWPQLYFSQLIGYVGRNLRAGGLETNTHFVLGLYLSVTISLRWLASSDISITYFSGLVILR